MVEVLERAFKAVSQLPIEEQERIGQWILAELEDDRIWDELLAKSLPLLQQLGAAALAEYHAGLTEAWTDPI